MISTAEIYQIKALILGFFFGFYLKSKLSKKPKAFIITGFKRKN